MKTLKKLPLWWCAANFSFPLYPLPVGLWKLFHRQACIPAPYFFYILFLTNGGLIGSSVPNLQPFGHTDTPWYPLPLFVEKSVLIELLTCTCRTYAKSCYLAGDHSRDPDQSRDDRDQDAYFAAVHCWETDHEDSTGGTARNHPVW